MWSTSLLLFDSSCKLGTIVEHPHLDGWWQAWFSTRLELSRTRWISSPYTTIHQSQLPKTLKIQFVLSFLMHPPLHLCHYTSAHKLPNALWFGPWSIVHHTYFVLGNWDHNEFIKLIISLVYLLILFLQLLEQAITLLLLLGLVL